MHRFIDISLDVLCPNLDEKAALQRIEYFERFMGFRPFQLHRNSANSAPHLQWSPLGVFWMCIHMTCFLLCVVGILTLDPDGAMSISDDMLAQIAPQIASYLHAATALAIFVTLFWRRDCERRRVLCEQRIEAHFATIGGAGQLHRQRSRRRIGAVLTVAFLSICISMVTRLVQVVVFLEKTVAPEEQQYMTLFCGAYVLPILYLEVIFGQFCVAVAFQVMRVLQLKELLQTLLEHEMALGDMQLGLY